jgi:hypothetical protein
MLLILPPIPDLSMPFNVMSLTCSLYAYIFGGIVAMLVKQSSDKIRLALHPVERPKSPLVRLQEKIRSKFHFPDVSNGKSKESKLLENISCCTRRIGASQIWDRGATQKDHLCQLYEANCMMNTNTISFLNRGRCFLFRKRASRLFWS